MREHLLYLLDMLYAPRVWVLSLSPYISLTLIGLFLAVLLGVAGTVLARLGYRPLWALLLLVPFANLIGIWVMAYRRFPRENLRSQLE